MAQYAILQAWFDREVTGDAKLVLLALADCYFEDTGVCNPSVAYLAELTGLSQATIHRRLWDLVKQEKIERHSGRYSRTKSSYSSSLFTRPYPNKGTVSECVSTQASIRYNGTKVEGTKAASNLTQSETVPQLGQRYPGDDLWERAVDGLRTLSAAYETLPQGEQREHYGQALARLVTDIEEVGSLPSSNKRRQAVLLDRERHTQNLIVRCDDLRARLEETEEERKDVRRRKQEIDTLYKKLRGE